MGDCQSSVAIKWHTVLGMTDVGRIMNVRGARVAYQTGAAIAQSVSRHSCREQKRVVEVVQRSRLRACEVHCTHIYAIGARHGKFEGWRCQPGARIVSRYPASARSVVHTTARE